MPFENKKISPRDARKFLSRASEAAAQDDIDDEEADALAAEAIEVLGNVLVGIWEELRAANGK